MEGTPTRSVLLRAALRRFDQSGYEAATVADICGDAGASNGSFFHHFGSKQGVAAALYVDAVTSYQACLVAPLSPRRPAAAGVAALVRGHLAWVVRERGAARFLFEQGRAEWMSSVRDDVSRANAGFANAVDAWRLPHVQAGSLARMDTLVFLSQVLGPAQVVCRFWLSGMTHDDPRRHAAALVQCAQRALVIEPPKTSRLRSP